ncbi:MAG: hypothetical protein UR26_C0004G0032 [candidate division TM6 bacterium GW2011_GWF2_32_72]|nr:MAG: hypothetical protein UR26_C0004G0032 [candidate division TM6 bacterium GW2011_GWF2_32_72]
MFKIKNRLILSIITAAITLSSVQIKSKTPCQAPIAMQPKVTISAAPSTTDRIQKSLTTITSKLFKTEPQTQEKTLINSINSLKNKISQKNIVECITSYKRLPKSAESPTLNNARILFGKKVLKKTLHKLSQQAYQLEEFATYKKSKKEIEKGNEIAKIQEKLFSSIAAIQHDLENLNMNSIQEKIDVANKTVTEFAKYESLKKPCHVVRNKNKYIAATGITTLGAGALYFNHPVFLSQIITKSGKFLCGKDIDIPFINRINPDLKTEISDPLKGYIRKTRSFMENNENNETNPEERTFLKIIQEINENIRKMLQSEGPESNLESGILPHIFETQEIFKEAEEKLRTELAYSVYEDARDITKEERQKRIEDLTDEFAQAWIPAKNTIKKILNFYKIRTEEELRNIDKNLVNRLEAGKKASELSDELLTKFDEIKNAKKEKAKEFLSKKLDTAETFADKIKVFNDRKDVKITQLKTDANFYGRRAAWTLGVSAIAITSYIAYKKWSNHTDKQNKIKARRLLLQIEKTLNTPTIDKTCEGKIIAWAYKLKSMAHILNSEERIEWYSNMNSLINNKLNTTQKQNIINQLFRTHKILAL